MSHYHDQMMDEYYSIREYQNKAEEEYSLGYGTERKEYWASTNKVTFKSFLISRKNNKECETVVKHKTDNDYEQWLLDQYDKSLLPN